MIGHISYLKMLLQGDRQLHGDADKWNTSLYLAGMELTEMKMQGLPYQQIFGANANR
jgi:hypothetical protein